MILELVNKEIEVLTNDFRRYSGSMKINHILNIPDHASMFINDTEVKHPTSVNTSTNVDGMVFALTVMPGNVDKDWICLAVFVDGHQHVIFSGTPADAANFFKNFPRN